MERVLQGVWTESPNLNNETISDDDMEWPMNQMMMKNDIKQGVKQTN